MPIPSMYVEEEGTDLAQHCLLASPVPPLYPYCASPSLLIRVATSVLCASVIIISTSHTSNLKPFDIPYLCPQRPTTTLTYYHTPFHTLGEFIFSKEVCLCVSFLFSISRFVTDRDSKKKRERVENPRKIYKRVQCTLIGKRRLHNNQTFKKKSHFTNICIGAQRAPFSKPSTRATIFPCPAPHHLP